MCPEKDDWMLFLLLLSHYYDDSFDCGLLLQRQEVQRLVQ